jgi:hypothetical protein
METNEFARSSGQSILVLRISCGMGRTIILSIPATTEEMDSIISRSLINLEIAKPIPQGSQNDAH